MAASVADYVSALVKGAAEAGLNSAEVIVDNSALGVDTVGAGFEVIVELGAVVMAGVPRVSGGLGGRFGRRCSADGCTRAVAPGVSLLHCSGCSIVLVSCCCSDEAQMDTCSESYEKRPRDETAQSHAIVTGLVVTALPRKRYGAESRNFNSND